MRFASSNAVSSNDVSFSHNTAYFDLAYKISCPTLPVPDMLPTEKGRDLDSYSYACRQPLHKYRRVYIDQLKVIDRGSLTFARSVLLEFC